MKLFPEGKPYYLWIFFGLWIFLLVEFLLIPPLYKIHIYKDLLRNAKDQTRDYNTKIELVGKSHF